MKLGELPRQHSSVYVVEDSRKSEDFPASPQLWQMPHSSRENLSQFIAASLVGYSSIGLRS